MLMYPNFNNYGRGSNAHYFTDIKGNRFYFSYQTIVAFIHENVCYCCENVWTVTTGGHLNWIESDKKKRLSYENFRAKFKECFGIDYQGER